MRLLLLCLGCSRTFIVIVFIVTDFFFLSRLFLFVRCKFSSKRESN